MYAHIIVVVVAIVAQLVMQTLNHAVITPNQHFTTSTNLSHLITFRGCVMCTYSKYNIRN